MTSPISYSSFFILHFFVLLLLCGGCLAPKTGRVIDARMPRTPDEHIASSWNFGPFYEHVITSEGNERTTLRPFLYSRIDFPKENHYIRDIFWPLYSDQVRGNNSSWRFGIWFGNTRDTSDPESRYSLHFLPFYIEKRPESGGDIERALFPIYGSIPNFLLYERISFAMWPIWMQTERRGTIGRHVLFPFVSWDRGTVNGWRFFPFYGHLEKKDEWERRFILWPFWIEEYSYKHNAKEGYEWCLIPFYGKAERPYEYSRRYLPPFFQFTYGRGRNEGERHILSPWPLVRIQDNKFIHKRQFWPFYASTWSDNAVKTHVLWPIYHEANSTNNSLSRAEWSVAPLFFRELHWQRRNAPVETNELTFAYTRVWPLASHVDVGGKSLLSVPDFTLTRRQDALSRNVLGFFTLYTYGIDSETNRTENDLLWGFLRWGTDEDGFFLSRLFWIPL